MRRIPVLSRPTSLRRTAVALAALVAASLALPVASASVASAAEPTILDRSAVAEQAAVVEQPIQHTAAAPQAPSAPARTTHSVTLDHYSFLVDGKRTYLWSGEFHSYRLPSPDLWLDIFQKMKAAGFNAVSLYFDWGYHSSAPGKYDFTGVRDADKLLAMAQQAGLYVIARPAPYINAEVDGGGLPTWLTTKNVKNRSNDAEFLKYADEWLTRIDAIIARHQLTNGTGSVIAYQVENEYYKNTDNARAYLQHLRDKAEADGITVPLTGNNNGTYNSGTGELDVDGPDSYPQGFDCSNPSRWNGVPDISYDHPADKPLYTPEFQGGAFDPWGGPGYDACAQLINDQFANVFYKNNIAVGATAQSFYMLYGGTNWGWLSMPQNYTSYDYGAAIRETRQLDPKFFEDKLIGYLTASTPFLTKTDPTSSTSENPAVVDTARINPDDGGQIHVLRHADSTSTAVTSTHIAIDLAAEPSAAVAYTYDDTDSALQYTGGWTPVTGQSYTTGDYRQTETFSNTAGDSVQVPFTGTAVRWIGPKTGNHGYADVYVDGVKEATVDDSGSQNQAVVFSRTGLTDGPHTLKIVVTGTHSAGSTDNFVSIDAIDVPTAAELAPPTYPSVPQEPGTAITLDGRDSRILLANTRLGATKLQYSTSEVMTSAAIGGRDVAVLYGNAGSDGETVLNFPKQTIQRRPAVTVTGGTVKTTWDPATGDLRLDYQHRGLLRVTVSGGVRPLQLLIADKDTAKTFWRQDTAAGPVLVRGTHLLRTASAAGGVLALTGDNGTDKNLEVFSTAQRVSWNGLPVTATATSTGSLVGAIPVAAPITLPALSSWKVKAESPESATGFDDSRWQVADKTTTASVTGISSLPVLYADDYGFHTGNTWYRGRYTATGQEKAIHLVSDSGGGAQAFSVWLNGAFLGSSTTGTGDFTIPNGAQRVGGDNVIAVLTVNMGHEEDYNSTNGNMTARGLTSASLVGAPLSTVTWRIQGVRGGENLIDPVRGPLSTGGLYGERAGWNLTGFDDSSWSTAKTSAPDTHAGVTWYRTTATLAVPKGQDTSLGLTITDDPKFRYRAMIFVNGWMMGNYVNYLGPQHSFPIPNGILNPNGRNTIAIAVWKLDATDHGLGTVAMTNYGSYASSLSVGRVSSPGYDAAKYAMPSAPASAVRVQVPSVVTPGQTFTATTTVSVPSGGAGAYGVSARLSVPTRWSSTGGGDSVLSILPGQTHTFRWTVTVPADAAAVPAAISTNVSGTQNGKPVTYTDERVVGVLPDPPPAGPNAVSDLPFLSASNGWGPVERDTNNGEQAAGDGSRITIAGAAFAKGLGTNSPSEVQLYAAGRCTRFTAQVGVDDQTGGAGSVTFSVVADGRVLVTTPVVKGRQSATAVDADVTGAQVVGLVVGDGGDGTGQDHADWATPTLTCS